MQSKRSIPVIQDQAESLRRIRFMNNLVKNRVFSEANPNCTYPKLGRLGDPSITRVISFTSGKGGVGKTSMVVNLAIGLAAAGKSVLVFDADLGLANVDVMLGIRPSATLQDVFEGDKSLDDIIVPGPEGISIIPAASGVESICTLDSAKQIFLMQAVEGMSTTYDYFLIDTQAGIGSDVMYFNSAASEIVVVITGEPTSLTDAYALIKVLSQNYGEKSFSVIANNVRDSNDGKRAFARLESVVGRFLAVELQFLGSVPQDESMQDAIRKQRAIMTDSPSAKASIALRQIVARLDEGFFKHRVKGGMQFFFSKLLEASNMNG